MEKFI